MFTLLYMDLDPGIDCGRTFNEIAYSKHSKICRKVFIQKRKVFDSKKARARGTELENFQRQQGKTMAVPKAASTAEKKVSWRVDPKVDYSAGMLADCSAVPKAASTAEKKVSWRVDPKAYYSAGMLADCSAVPKAASTAEKKVSWMVETMAVPKAASTAEKKVS